MNVSTKGEKLILAVDIGGTKVAVASLTSDGAILSRLIEPTLQKGPDAGIHQIIRMLEAVIQQGKYSAQQFIGIGIGIPAVLEPDTDFIIWGPNLQGWKNVDLRGALEKHFNLSVCLEYDGHTAVLGEWWMGAAKNHQSVVSVIIGTGVGGGMVLEGNLVRGLNRLAGAVGWFVMNHPARVNTATEKALGSWESSIAGPGIALRMQQLLENEIDTPSILRNNEGNVTAVEVFAAAKQGDSLALKIVNEEAELLGMGLANIVSLVNPEIIVLGGSVGSNIAFLLPQIVQYVGLYAQPISNQSVKIVTSRLGVDAGLFGAAYGIMLRMKQE